MRNKVQLTASILIVCLLLVLSACQGDKVDPETSVHYGISNAWDSLMPYNSPSGSNYSRMVYDKIYDRLAFVHEDGTLSPRAAQSWEGADEGYAVLFQLDQAAAFHDGTPVTAEHWVQTLALLTNPACPTLGRSAFRVLSGTDEEGRAVDGQKLGAQVIDPYTLKLIFKAPTTPEDFLLDKNREFYVLPTHLLQDTAPEDVMKLALWDAPIGSGPCSFVSEIVGSQLTLQANPKYQLGAPGFDNLVITVMDKANLLTALIAGDLDYYAIGGSVTVEDAKVAGNAGLKIRTGGTPVTFYELMLNGQALPDARLRRAVELALDKELLCEQTSAGLGRATDTCILPGSYGPSHGGQAAQGRSIEAAKTLLEQAGYDGTAYRLACTSNRAGLAALMQQNLADAGIQVVIETVDSAALFSGMADGSYDMAIASHTPGPLPLWFIESRFAENNNIFHVQNLSPYQAYIDAIKSTQNHEARWALVAELDAYLMEERPFIPLWFATALHVESPTVKGINYAAASFSNDNVWEWTKE